MRIVCKLRWFLLWILIVSDAYTQEVVVDSSVEFETEETVLDSIHLNEGLPAPEWVELPDGFTDSLKAKKEFTYLKNLDSLLKNYKAEPAKPNPTASPSIFSYGLIRVLLWSFAIFAVLYILFQLVLGKDKLFYQNKRSLYNPEEELPQHKDISPLQLSQQAAKNGQYREAVRYQYAYLLQLLGEKNYIILLPQKTSQHYVTEVSNKPFAAEFGRLTLQYEYIWFGNMHPKEDQYAFIQEGYRNFISKWL